MPTHSIGGELRTRRIFCKNAAGEYGWSSPFPDTLELAVDNENTKLRIVSLPVEQRLTTAGVERRAIELGIVAPSSDEAFDKAFVALEWMADYAAFWLKQAVYWTTQAVSDSGIGHLGNLPSMDNPKWRASVPMTEPPNVPITSIPAPPKDISEKTLGAMRWYHKGAAADYDLERFIAFWIAAELLAPESPAKPTAYMRSRNCECGDVPVCLTCGKSTLYTPPGAGPMVSAFLRDDVKLEATVVRELSDFRQLLHGAGRLTRSSTKEAAKFARIVQDAVSRTLKKRLDLPEHSPPIVPRVPKIGSQIDPVRRSP